MPLSFIAALVILFDHSINIQYERAREFEVVTSVTSPRKDNTIIKNYRPITQLSAI